MSSYTVQMECKCYKRVHAKPRDWDTEYCRNHGWQQVIEYTYECWHSRCRQCYYHRRHGMSKRYAEQAATAHTQRTGHYDVVVQFYDDRKPAGAEVQEIILTTGQERLPLDLPPF